jgi:hypothetical protein
MALVKTCVSEELSASFIKVTRIGELGITPTRDTRHNIPEDAILQIFIWFGVGINIPSIWGNFNFEDNH